MKETLNMARNDLTEAGNLLLQTPLEQKTEGFYRRLEMSAPALQKTVDIAPPGDQPLKVKLTLLA